MYRGSKLADILRNESLARLIGAAARLRDRPRGQTISYLRKVFIPLTRLSRNVCRYCGSPVRPSTLHRASAVVAAAKAAATSS